MALLNAVPHCIPGFTYCFFKVCFEARKSYVPTHAPGQRGPSLMERKHQEPKGYIHTWASQLPEPAPAVTWQGASVPSVPCGGHRKAERCLTSGGNLGQHTVSPLKADLSFFPALLRSSFKLIPRQFGHWVSLGLNACSNWCLKSKPENHSAMFSWKVCSRAGIWTQASLL